MVRKGFTLIELLIVVAIIGILAAIAVPNFLNAQIRAKVSKVQADFRSLATAIESYRLEFGNYMPTRNGGRTPVPDISTRFRLRLRLSHPRRAFRTRFERKARRTRMGRRRHATAISIRTTSNGLWMTPNSVDTTSIPTNGAWCLRGRITSNSWTGA